MSTLHLAEHMFDLPSPAVSMSITASSWLNIHTARHSLLTYKFSTDIGNLQFEEQPTWAPQFADEVDRDGLDHIVLTDDMNAAASQVILISDKACSVAGLSNAPSLEPLAQNQHTLFEAELSASILKFSCGNTRPAWNMARKDTESRNATTCLHGAEVLGITIDGSIRHFTVLSEAVYKLLYLLQNRAHQIKAADTNTPYQPIYWRSDPDPSIKHIDGDFLKTLLSRGCLERLLEADDSSDYEDGIQEDGEEMEEEREAQTRVFIKEFYILLMNTLDEAKRQVLVRGESGGGGDLFEMCREETYQLLDSLLRPVL